jgi:hypothetical protein
MNSQYALLWVQILSHAENALLHLASVLRPDYAHLPASQINRNTRFRAHAFNLLRAVHIPSIENVEVHSFVKICIQLSLSRHDEHVSHEESVIDSRAQYSNFESIPGVPADISVDDVKLQINLLIKLLSLLYSGSLLPIVRQCYGRSWKSGCSQVPTRSQMK